ncbi:MAG: hypothetical protein COS14_01680 [Bacteroidetes bacterium CG02_land_8_20_14_3_00_31_25]|nr:hypothetical protein [Bacteroidota bacterium]PIV62730.1 MAG: hypothetical protein COS14_01680 [Bacteroidetes bacterium CG02_land_8_20_14_3_00_31_25]PIX32418.1 MAG: hypothetical protein COZ59_14085 [Bacteroidetes bacterium CG_4_8_14_3_um_filter_31_14]PIY02209.1 MAG: hypothetical protein COZ21_15355 [Bacteroidetes bacterium CG_4_10_14_3_um_filter_31_20]
MLKKIASYSLVAMVIAFTVLGLLAIWDVIEVQDAIRKILLSLFVIFVASVVVLFIFGVVIRDDKSTKQI